MKNSESPVAKPFIAAIDPYKPGKSKVNSSGENIGPEKAKLANKPIKLSSNENALGASPKAVKAYLDAVDNLFRYPDGASADLRKAIAEKYNLDAERIVCGAGSDEIIALLAQAFAGSGDEIVYSEYGFLMYPISAKKVGATPIVAGEQNLKTDPEQIIAAISDKTKIIFIANPNNPTGSYLTAQELELLLSRVPGHIIVVLDLAYCEFVDATDYPNHLQLAEKYENVVLTRTFSKIYGLASLRLGWSYSSLYVADILNRVRGPFNVSNAAQAAGIAAINDEEFALKSKKHNQIWLKTVSENLQKVGYKIYPSVANFILVDFLSEQKCREVNDYLLSNSIIVREMAAYNLPTCLRISIGTEVENKLLLDLLLNQISK